MDRILVTGGAGYIGSHCCQALAEAGFEPVVYDSLHTGHEGFVRWGALIQADVRDEAALRAAFRKHRPVAVIHFAALSLVGESTTDPGRYWQTNVGGTLNLLNAMREAAVPNLVFSSTCAVYGDVVTTPINETAARQPVSPYGATKHACERMMEDFDAAHGLRSVRLRYFNAAGADPGGAIGEWHEPETHLVPLILDAAAGFRPEIQVFGTDYPTPDGTAIRDYIHVMDLAAAHVAALKHLLAGGASAAVNLGTGEGTSVAEAVAMVEAVTGRRVPARHVARRAGDPAVLLADPSMAWALLGWKAERGLRTIVEDAWRWHGKLAAMTRTGRDARRA